MNLLFREFSQKVSLVLGTSTAFILAALLIVVWAATGPIFDYSSAWQLVVNTATTIITFLMVFIIQNTQNRDSKAIQLKLDELIRSVKDARNEFIDAEDLDDEELERLRDDLKCLKEKYGEEVPDSANKVAGMIERRKARKGQPTKQAENGRGKAGGKSDKT